MLLDEIAGVVEPIRPKVSTTSLDVVCMKLYLGVIFGIHLFHQIFKILV